MRGSVLVLLLLTACDGGVAADAGSPDAALDGGADAGSDAGVDAGPPPSRFCAPCRRDADCGDGNLCLFLADGSFCGHPCAADDDCAGLGLDARCEAEAPGFPVSCRPASGACIESEPASDCPCAGAYDRCVDTDGLGPHCTTECRVDADCPIGMRRCRDLPDGRFCVRDEASPPERCQALVDAGLATECVDGACPDGGACHTVGERALCLSSPSGGACPDGATLHDGLCVPDLPSPDPWSALLTPDCHCAVEPSEATMLDEALAAIERDRCGMSFPHRFLDAFPPALSHDRFRLSWTDRAHSYWPASLAMGRALSTSLDDATRGDGAASQALREASRWADLPIAAPPADASPDLTAALGALVTGAGGAPDPGLAAAVASLPDALETRLVPVVDALRHAILAREAAIERLPERERADWFDLAGDMALGRRGTPLAATRDDVQGALLGDVDVAAMASAAVALLEAIEAAQLETLVGTDATLTVETPAGRFAVRGAGDDTYEAAEWDGALFLLDLGGDDTYRFAAGATASADHGVGVAIDVGGTDTYGYAEVAVPSDEGPPGHRRLPSDGAGRASDPPQSLSEISRQGAGRLGVGLLLDLGPEGDRYRSLRLSQGWGALGVGLLYDRGGDDVYEGEAGVQGGASFGVGVLLDGGGNDSYVAYHGAQGYAYVRAVGLLYDRDGDDTYLGVVDDVLYTSPQDATSNSSFVQGAGFGRRADFTDGVFMSGGLGVLRDRAGRDRYTAGVFAQATGFWYGAGMLLEGGGDDHYDGVWYVQSGDAHYAISVLLEDGGSDDFNQLATRRNVALGGGHDFSIAWFVDAGGDDVYRAPGISYGAGNEGGAGIFADLAGADRYDATRDNSFGHAAISRPGEDPLRQMHGTVGVFLDADGVDTYARPEIAPVANDATWQQARTGPEEGERGVGVDRSGGRAGL